MQVSQLIGLADCTLSKFDLERAKEACSWIEDVTHSRLNPPSDQMKDQKDVQRALKDGQALCALINTIQPGSVKKVNQSKLAFKEMENIEMFLRACKEYGMNEVDTFQTQDLYETKSMYSVVNSLHILGSLARKNGFSGPTIGVKLAEKNVRMFSDETLQAGKMVLSMQFGTNKGASQKGMTPYGATRKM
ncbi:hypothetical protein LSH36_68g01041 [Paralvinella palmiformis]|uniref:Calponin-homology (CH) domain-containing protein n=1 Tax=Paralvinella palmiformis TaxID=53620 RepID=A0AAD9K3J1_9ANNE|nr:hypothetical protein LSH36_68g01041 [Paralvinella palmiformis]